MICRYQSPQTELVLDHLEGKKGMNASMKKWLTRVEELVDEVKQYQKRTCMYLASQSHSYITRWHIYIYIYTYTLAIAIGIPLSQSKRLPIALLYYCLVVLILPKYICANCFVWGSSLLTSNVTDKSSQRTCSTFFSFLVSLMHMTYTYVYTHTHTYIHIYMGPRANHHFRIYVCFYCLI